MPLELGGITKQGNRCSNWGREVTQLLCTLAVFVVHSIHSFVVISDDVTYFLHAVLPQKWGGLSPHFKMGDRSSHPPGSDATTCTKILRHQL